MEKTMSPENILNSAIEGIKSGMNSVENKYDSHIREKAIEEVNKKIAEKGLEINQIENDPDWSNDGNKIDIIYLKQIEDQIFNLYVEEDEGEQIKQSVGQ